MTKPKLKLQIAENERGAVLALVAILMTVIIAFASLAIDGVRLFTSDSEHRHNAEFIALAAIDGYYSATVDETSSEATKHNVRLQNSLERAEQVGGYASYMTLDANQVVSVGSLSLPTGYITSGTHTGDSGVIVPGRWWSIEPSNGCGTYPDTNNACPCPLGIWQGSCFEAVDSTDRSINAFNVRLKTPDSSPLRFLLTTAGEIDQKTAQLNASTFATLTPRRGMFLIDLSRSVVSETHIPKNDTVTEADPDLQRTFVAYELNKTSSACPANGTSGLCPTSGSCTFVNYSEDASYNNLYASPPSIANSLDDIRGAIEGPPTRHFKDDYLCYRISYKDASRTNGTVSNITRHFLVDTNWSNTNVGPDYYVGPQPLTNIFTGIHTALSLFKERAVRTDLAGAIGFDRSSAIDVRTMDLTNPDSSEFESMVKKFDVSNPSDMAAQELRATSMLFPRPNADPVLGNGATNSDLLGALQTATEKLTALSDAAATEDFIVLFTDGLTNCIRNPSQADGKYCNDNSTYYLSSINELLAYARDTIKPLKIPVHLVMFGKHGGPHTLLYYDGRTGKCIPEEEKVTNRYFAPDSRLYASGGTYDGTDTYYSANRIRMVSRYTDGLFLPVRPPCQKNGHDADITEDLEAICQTKYAARTRPSPFPQAVGASDYTDTRSRLLCDPKGRSESQQIEDFMAEILGENPYSLVQ